MENQNESGSEIQTVMMDVVSFDVTTETIGKLREKYCEFPIDLTVKDNYEVVRAGLSEIKKLRGKVEARRKELKADALAYGKKVDGAAKEIKESLMEIEAPMALVKKEFDTKKEIEKRQAARREEERIDTIHESIASLKALVEQNISSSSNDIKEVLDGLRSEKPEEWAYEFCDKAKVVISETIAKLEELAKMKIANEEAERIAAKREAEDARRKEAEVFKKAEEDKKRAEELSRREADMAAKEADIAKKQKVIDEQNRKIVEAEKAKKAEEERLEREKIAEIKRKEQEKEEISRKEAEKKERERLAKIAIDNAQARLDAAVEDFSVYMESKTAITIINAIRGGEFKHIKWVD